MKALRKTLRIALSLALDDIRTNPGRSAIIVLSLFFGVSSVLMTLGVLRAMNRQIAQDLEQNGGIRMIYYDVTKPATAIDKVRYGMSPGLLPDHMDRLAREIPGIESAVPRASMMKGTQISYGNASYDAIDVAVSPPYLGIYTKRTLRQGRMFTQEEYEQAAAVCMLDSSLAFRFFGSKPWLDNTVALAGRPLKVIGILATPYEEVVTYPITFYWKNFASRGTPLKKCEFVARRAEDAERTAAELEAALLQQHRGVRDFEIFTAVQGQREMVEQQRMGRIITVAVGLIALVLGIVGIVNVFLSIINDRVREIGMLKALGSSNSDIFLQHLAESLVLALLGGGLGLLGGSLLSKSSVLPWPGLLLTADYLTALLASCVAGVCAGLIPAWAASRLPPAQAMGWQ